MIYQHLFRQFKTRVDILFREILKQYAYKHFIEAFERTSWLYRTASNCTDGNTKTLKALVVKCNATLSY